MMTIVIWYYSNYSLITWSKVLLDSKISLDLSEFLAWSFGVSFLKYFYLTLLISGQKFSRIYWNQTEVAVEPCHSVSAIEVASVREAPRRQWQADPAAFLKKISRQNLYRFINVKFSLQNLCSNFCFKCFSKILFRRCLIFPINFCSADV